MQTDLVDPIANALLYEGYLLYPYRAAVKNVKRWNFGGIYPRHWIETRNGAFPWRVRGVCLAVGDGDGELAVQARFLHLMERSTPSSAANGPGPAAWQECVERCVDIETRTLSELSDSPHRQSFAFPSACFEADDSAIVRRQESIQGSVDVFARRGPKNSYVVTVAIENESPLAQPEHDNALLWSFASAHAVVQLRGAEFVSRIDPPTEFRDVIANDPEDRLWPILVGEPGRKDTMLCSPIILYDYPEIAPASAGDFYDATEIDEMLTLRILTLSDDEKREVEVFDPRGRELLERTRSLAQDQIAKLHGTMRRVGE